MNDLRDLFFQSLLDKSSANENFYILTADMDVFAIKEFKKNHPERFIDVGVAEQNLINVAAGIAKSGGKVVIFGILSFLTTRCYEQIKLNICGMELPVLIVGIGTGISFSYDGPTHHSLSDIGTMRMIPELKIYAPSDKVSCDLVVNEVSKFDSPALVRLDKGNVETYFKSIIFQDGIITRKPEKQINIVYTGTVGDIVLNLLSELTKIHYDVGVIEIYKIKPLPNGLLNILQNSQKTIVVEENTTSGGLFSSLTQTTALFGIENKIFNFSFPDTTILRYGSRDWLRKYYFPSTEQVIHFLKD